MNLAFIDDQELEVLSAIEDLKKMLQDREIISQIDYYSGGEEFLNAYQPGYYSVIFIDIYMKSLSGPEIARKIREKEPDTLLIFLTNTGEYMPEAFSLHAFEYIQKPCTTERICHVMEEVLRVLPVRTEMLTFSYKRQQIHLPCISVVSAVSRLHHVDVWDEHGNLYSPYCTFSGISDALLKTKTFLLLNKGILVNMAHIRTFHNRNCEMSNGQVFPVTAKKAVLCEQLWRNYIFSTMIPTGRITE